MAVLYPIWLFFAAIFYYFAYIHWRMTGEELRPFQFREGIANPEEEGAQNQAQVDFAHDFNMYLNSVNAANGKRNRTAAISYAIAGTISLASLFVLLFFVPS